MQDATQSAGSGPSRREVLRSGGLLGATVALGGLLAACTSRTNASNTATSPASTGPTVARKKGGTLRVGVGGGGATDTLDPAKEASQADYVRNRVLYSPLFERDPSGNFRGVLAESAEPNASGTVWTVPLRRGVTFHDGQTFNADAVLTALARVFALTGAATATELKQVGITPKTVSKLDSHTLRFSLPAPLAIFEEILAPFFITAPNWNPKTPVGTGPFKFKSFAPGQQSEFVANRDWFGPNGPWVDDLLIKNISDDSARLNALQAGQVDVINSVPFAQARTITSNSALQLVRQTRSAGWTPMNMRVDVAPFTDIRVRKAFRLAVDRPQMVAQVLAGQGRIGNDLYAPQDPDYDSSLPQYAQDPGEARALLKEAGHPDGVTVTLTTAPCAAGVVEMTQVFVSQAARCGITIKLNQVDNATLFGTQYLKWPMSVDFWPCQGYLKTAAAADGPGAPYNGTRFHDAEFNSLYNKAVRTIDAAARKTLVDQMQQIEHTRGGLIIPYFAYDLDAASTKVVGWQQWNGGGELNDAHLEEVGFSS